MRCLDEQLSKVHAVSAAGAVAVRVATPSVRNAAQGLMSFSKNTQQQGVSDILAAYVQVDLKKYASHFG